jgi:hypothetical protein
MLVFENYYQANDNRSGPSITAALISAHAAMTPEPTAEAALTNRVDLSKIELESRLIRIPCQCGPLLVQQEMRRKMSDLSWLEPFPTSFHDC